MRYYLTPLLLLAILWSGSVQKGMAQEDRHPTPCATVLYNQIQEEQNPQIRIKRELFRKQMEEYIRTHPRPPGPAKDIVTIPVVIHVVWNTPEQNISDDKVWSQFFILNDDYRRHNADSVNTPLMFKPVAADCGIEFCLARRTPDSLPTNGIIRKYTTETQFDLDNRVKSDYTGGSSPWDCNKYLNIWICKLASNYLGYSQYPGGTDSTDGVVIDYECYGNVEPLNPSYNKGRTSTHEIGHWMDLYHIWGDDFGSCAGSDYVDDTPNAADANYFCPNHPHTSACNSTGEMFQNYMDYTDDVCMNIFTYGQRDRMLAAINLYRTGLLTSDGCDSVVGIADREIPGLFSVFPNPASQSFTLQMQLNNKKEVSYCLVDPLGNGVIQKSLGNLSDYQGDIDISGLSPGIYYLRIQAGKQISVHKVVVIH